MLSGMPKHSVCAEVGTFEGDFAAAILDIVEPRTLHLIDPWQHRDEPDYARAMYGGGRDGGQARLDDIHSGVVERFAAQLSAGQVVIHRESSASVLDTFADASLDWIYVDGDHLYAAVVADLELAFAKVKPGGFIACDDYGIEGWWDDGVTRAVHEFLPRYPCKAAFVNAQQFVMRKQA